MKPYFETNNGKLYCGDCFDVIDYMISQNMKANCIVTDPPYGMNFVSNYRKEKYSAIINDDNLDWINEWVNKINNILNDNSHLYVCCSWHNVDIFKQEIQKKFEIKNIIIWEKNNTGMGDLESQFAPKYEMIIYAIKGKRKLNGSRDADIIKEKRTNNELHPTQKPIDLIKYLIEKSTNNNDVVIDSFSGSGTTAVACEQANRKWICIEQEKKYCDVTVERLKNIQQCLF
jgi:site-specific DNA-methyltransferase (adenine-specific)